MKLFRNIIMWVAALAAALSLFSCQEKEPQSYVENVALSVGDRKVSFRGATVTVSFDVPAAWSARLELKNGEGEWAAVKSNTQSGDAKKGALVRVAFEENRSSEERIAELWISMDGYEDECVCTMIQAVSEDAADAAVSKSLNEYMHEILKKDYLFADAYNQLDVDLSVNYKEFLSKHLLAMGNVNEADGGYYKYGDNFGDRFIYTNIAEVQVGTKAIQTEGLGFGPFVSTILADGSSDVGIAPAYVRRGSPAEAAGLRRGDLIYGVNGTRLTLDNYSNFMYSLYQGTTGTFKFDYMRLEAGADGMYGWNHYKSGAAAAGMHVYDPVLHASIMKDPDNTQTKIGYLVYESFDLNSQELLEDAIDQFVAAGITELVLDLRFNAGGAVAQSRWLSGCIAGETNKDKTFTKVIYNDGSQENWTFGYGYDNDVDNLGLPTYLGLKRLFVITSYNTASAAELVINSLNGVDFPVYLIGGQTEGKNVGMTVSEVDHGARRFLFSPVTFWVRNAKDFGDYPDGIEPDEIVTERDNNVFPYSFADWGNLDKNEALQWAYCEITGKERWSQLGTKAAAGCVLPCPLDFQPVKVEAGKYGNLLYK